MQPVEWRSSYQLRTWLARLLSMLWPLARGWMRHALSERRADHMMLVIAKGISINRPGTVQVDRLPWLSRIQRAHIVDFLLPFGFPDKERESLVSDILAGTHTSEDVMEALGKYVSQRRPNKGRSPDVVLDREAP